MGPASWDFSKSWASSFAVLGAILGSFVAAKGVFPDKPNFMTAGAYAGLNLFFGVVVVAAPFFYRATSQPAKVQAGQGAAELQYQGFVWSFLVACTITLWGVFGELVTVLMLIWEDEASKVLPQGVLVAFGAVVGLVAILVVYYAWRSIHWTIAEQAVVKQTDAKRSELMAAFTIENMTAVEVSQPRPNWSVF